MKRVALVAAIVWSLVGATAANAAWKFGLGTGIAGTKLDGTIGLYSPVLGTVEAEVKLDPSDFQDLISTAFGLGGFATDGKWMITAQGAFIELAGDGTGTTSDGDDASVDLSFKMTQFESHVGYNAYHSSNMKFFLQPYAGVRFIKHKIENNMTVGSETALVEHDNSWADGLIGAGIVYAVSPKVALGASADGGFGGSEGTATARGSMTWKPLPHWSFSPNVLYQTGKYEASEKGETDWYLFDMKTTQFGLGVMFHF